MMPPIRSTADRATLDDLILPTFPDVTTITPYPFTQVGILQDIAATAARGTQQAFDDSALAAVMQEVDAIRADTAARQALLDAIDTVIRPAIADATRGDMGVLIAYGPDEEVVARPSNAVRPGQALLIRTDKLRVDNPLPPLAFIGANA